MSNTTLQHRIHDTCNLQSFSLFHCHSATHFKASCNNNHIWYTSPGLSPSQALGFGKPSIRAWLTILKAQAHQSQAQARALSPSQARYITTSNTTKGVKCQVLTLASAMLICD